MANQTIERLFVLVDWLGKRSVKEAQRATTYAQLDSVRAKYLGKQALCNRVMRAMYGKPD